MQPPTDPTPTSRDRLVIAILLVASFTVILNETIMNVALPRLMTDLHVDASTVQWLATAFMLTMAVVIPTTGFLLQRLTTRAVFFTAMTAFSLGTLLAGLAPTFEVLLLARVVQATGTAVMLPLLITTVLTLVPPQRRGVVMGNLSIVISVAPAVGPTLSGLILGSLSWRWMFLLVLPVALAALLLGARALTNVGERRESTLDALSVPLAALGFGGLVYGLSTIGTPAGLAGAAWPLGLGVVALALFTWRQLRLARRDAALLDLRAFRFPAFTLGVLLMMIAMTALFGGAILLPLYFQTIRGLDTLQTGLLLLPGGLVMGLLAPLVGRLFDRVGPLPLVVPGAVLMTAVLWAFGGIDARTPVWLLLGLHLVLSVGLALLFTPVFTSTLAPLPARLHSHGSAILSTAQQVAGAAGTALLVTVMTARTAALTRGGASPVAAQTAGLQAAFVLAAVIAVLAVLLALLQRRSTAGPGLHEDGALNAAD